MAEICNAVLVIGRTRMLWVEDAASIAQWDRVEGSISAGQITDEATLQRIGEQYLAARAQPVVAHVVEIASNGPVLGDDINLGDTLTAGEDADLRVVGATWNMAADGTLSGLPELQAPFEALADASERRVQAMIDAAGGVAGASAPVLDAGTAIPTGRLQTIKLAAWSWNDAADLDNPWDPAVEEGDGGVWGQPFDVEEPCRLYEWVIDCRWKDDDDVQLTSGPSSFQLYLDDAPIAPGFIIEIPETGVESVTQAIYGPALLTKGQKLRPVNVVNGGHEQGAIQIRSTTPT